STSGARTSRARASARRRRGAGTSRWGSSRTTTRCSTSRRRASTASGAGPTVRAASCDANARPRSTSLPPEARHEVVEVAAGGRDRLLRADELEELLRVSEVHDRPEQHLLLLRDRRAPHHPAGRVGALDLDDGDVE